jgi:nucleoside 2-deoxyribosyltransferase
MALLTVEDLKKIIANGESKTVEFKSNFRSDHEIGRLLSALANTDGGILIIGITDDKVTGLTDDEAEYAYRHLDKITSLLLPALATVGILKIDNTNIVYVNVEKAPEYYVPILTSSGEAFVREGPRTTLVTTSDFISLSEKINVEVTKVSKEMKVFVAMSFREEEEPALVDYYKAMERGANATKFPFILNRVDLVEGDYEISQKIMDEIDDCDIVITDLTLNSRNVYFELGYARGKMKKIIQTARVNTPLEFDIRNWRTLFYKNATELEEKIRVRYEAAYAELIQKID